MTTKFSIQIENQAGYDWELTKKVIHKTEELGYHSFYICDHFFLDNQSENRHALEAWSVLSAAATLTNKIKLGTLVTGNNYRNPALLAKIASTLDMISNGRMEFGIGAGWKEIEYEAYGYDFPAVKDRMDMLEESILIIKEMWSKPRATFEGKHYRIKDAVLSPKPDNPLFMIGGGGEKRTLKLVAKYADYCNLFSIAPKEIDKKLAALKNHCNTIGRDYESVGKSLFIFGAFVSESQEEIDKFIEERAKLYKITTDEMRTRIYDPHYPGSWVGTPEQLRDRIEHMNGLGFDYYFLQQYFNLDITLIDSFSNLVKDKYFK